ncbi:MAG: hypothetical protein JWQ48_202 [Conexibacter sp.]|nr:hypothetical protein [Conexibacter sp.]
MAFAGDTLWAYPIIVQTANNIAAYRPSLERSYDLLHAKGHAVRVINAMIQHGDAIHGPDAPDSGAEFLFAGFSASEGDFRIWKLMYESPQRRFVAERVGRRRIGRFCFIGDTANAATRDLYDLMDREYPEHHALGMQPLEVIRRMLVSGEYETIGGPPQVVKVYKHMNSEGFVVPWRVLDGTEPVRTLFGRALLDYEALDAPQIDLDSAFGAPGSGRGDQLRSWDELVLPAIIDCGATDREGLARTAEDQEWTLGAHDIDEWLEFALRRGVITNVGDGTIIAARRHTS